MPRHLYLPRPDPRLARFLSGAYFCAFGTALACAARFVDRGAEAAWSAVPHPVVAGILCALAGDIVMAMTLLQRNPLRVGPRLATSLLAVLGGNALFAMALGGFSDYGLPAIGMVSGIYLAGFAWSLSGEDIRPAALLAFAGVLGLGSYLAHVVTLGIPMPLWPSFIVG